MPRRLLCVKRRDTMKVTANRAREHRDRKGMPGRGSYKGHLLTAHSHVVPSEMNTCSWEGRDSNSP